MRKASCILAKQHNTLALPNFDSAAKMQEHWTGTDIRQLRLALSLSQKMLADRLGVSTSQVRSWEGQSPSRIDPIASARLSKIQTETTAARHSRDLMNDVHRFSADRITIAPARSLTASALYEEYCSWCEEQNIEPLALPRFGLEFGELGIQKVRIAGRTRYVGIALQSVQKEPTDIPAPSLASIKPVWRNNILCIDSQSLEPPIAPPSLEALLSSLKVELLSLAEQCECESNIDRRWIAYIREVGKAIPSTLPSQFELFRLAHAEELLRDYAAVSAREWPDFLALRYDAILNQLRRVVRLFPGWSEFIRRAENKHLTREQVTASTIVAKHLAAAMESDVAKEFVDPNVPTALAELASLHTTRSSEPAQAQSRWGTNSLTSDIVESVNNILKALGMAAAELAASSHITLRQAGAGYGDKFQSGFVSKAKDYGQKDGQLVVTWVRRLLFGGVSLSGAHAIGLSDYLIKHFPKDFAWIDALSRLLL